MADYKQIIEMINNKIKIMADYKQIIEMMDFDSNNFFVLITSVYDGCSTYAIQFLDLLSF